MRERSRPYTGQAMTLRTLWLALVLGTSVAAVAPRGAMALGDTTGAPCGVTAGGGTASNNTITCNFGLTPEQLREVTKAAIEGATEPLIGRIADISKRLGITEEAAKTLLRIVGEQSEVPDERLAEALTKVANDYKRLQTQVAALNPDNPVARDLVEGAKSEIASGHFAAAHRLLMQARQAQIAAAQEANKLAERAQASRDAQLLGAAASAAAEGDLAMTELHYAQAADLFKQAAELVPAGHTDETTGYLQRQADALYSQGDERGDNTALKLSIDAWRLVLQERTRDRVPLDWAATQMNLGNALQRLGERESGTARLEEAVAAYRAALGEYTRDRVPLGQAYSERGLANGLAALAIREKSAPRMKEALTCMRAAVEIYRQSAETYWLQKATVRVTEMEAELVNLQQ
jgi:tetratricopeptide (TPR) repeat protein